MARISPDNSLQLGSDSTAALRARAATDPKGAVKQAARQFEGLFMQEVVKSMRAATPASELDNEGSRLGTELLDAQFAGKMSGMPGGLSEAIERHLQRQMGLNPGPIPDTGAARGSSAAKAEELQRGDKPVRIPQTAAALFVQQNTEAAKAAAAETGIPATFMLAQAAHESGWGKRTIRNADGSSANNLFGIKASPDWKGPVAETLTTEFINGQERKVVARFRAYGSTAESFADYARLMKQSPRYQKVVASVANAPQADARVFAQGLQRAGYATDPAYADKLTRMINTTLRLQRSMA